MSKHTLSVLVENTPGILARIAALFSRRGFNIDSLAVGVTDDFYVSTGVGLERNRAPQIRFLTRPSFGVVTLTAPDG